MLTVIALALVALVFKNGHIIESAQAATTPAAKLSMTVPVNADGSINLRIIPTSDMNVNIISASPTAFRLSTMPVELASVDNHVILPVTIRKDLNMDR